MTRAMEAMVPTTRPVMTPAVLNLRQKRERMTTGRLPEEWRPFNREFIPIFLAGHPGKTKIAAGLACGFLWTVSRGIEKGDVVLCPDGSGRYRVGEVCGDYKYAPGENLPHRRPVRWLSQIIDRADMSEELRNSAAPVVYFHSALDSSRTTRMCICFQARIKRPPDARTLHSERTWSNAKLPMPDSVR